MKKILVLILLLGCVSVRIITGEDNSYEGSNKETTGIKSNVNINDSIPSVDSVRDVRR